jgi:hypothetical protein
MPKTKPSVNRRVRRGKGTIMALTIALLTCLILAGLVLSVGLFSLLEVLLSEPAARRRRIDTRTRAAEALVHDPESLLAQLEMLRNVSQSA